MKRARTPAPPPSFSPWRCATLAVDPGESCGVAIFRCGQYVDSGHGDGYDTRWVERWISNAVFFANVLAMPLVLVLEEPPKGGAAYAGRSPLGAASVIGCRKVWLHAWMAAPVVRRAVVSVQPQSWRGPLLGSVRETHAQERILGCRTKYGAAGFALAMNPDEAAAICIACWAAFAGQVGAVLPAQPKPKAKAKPKERPHDGRSRLVR